MTVPLIPSLLIGKGRKLPTEVERQHTKAKTEDKTEQRIEIVIDAERPQPDKEGADE